jgi:hypothetical protein
MTVTHIADRQPPPHPDQAEKLRRRYGTFTRDESPSRFGQPSSYSLSRLELARHVRQLRRSGWQSWEVAVRFDFGQPDHAA